MEESRLEKRLKKGVEKRGGQCVKLGPFFVTGWPDRLVLMPGGKLWFVEMKRPGGRYESRQRYVARQIRELGFEYRLIDSIDKIEIFLNGL